MTTTPAQTPHNPYDPAFFAQLNEKTPRSAAIILDWLYRHYQSQSVVDVGCGQGVWLAAAEVQGASLLKGLDGHWVKPAQLASQHIDFQAVDFEGELPSLSQTYDLCISLEVAEHISPARATEFIQFLCQAANVVLFSAAVKHQGGTNHINEQWQSYWIERFDQNGYDCLDVIRPQIWQHPDVAWYYQQNMFLFVNRAQPPEQLAQLQALTQPIFDLAHPLSYETKVRMHQKAVAYYEGLIAAPPLRFCLGCLKRWLLHKLGMGRAEP
ncbi:MAG: methyltransferase domain-containing protein [Spirulina sp. SIO3F2]|nr:methyltransferase domain-containing protein [Spirulina sp. SIO3F2]